MLYLWISFALSSSARAWEEDICWLRHNQCRTVAVETKWEESESRCNISIRVNGETEVRSWRQLFCLLLLWCQAPSLGPGDFIMADSTAQCTGSTAWTKARHPWPSLALTVLALFLEAWCSQGCKSHMLVVVAEVVLAARTKQTASRSRSKTARQCCMVIGSDFSFSFHHA